MDEIANCSAGFTSGKASRKLTMESWTVSIPGHGGSTGSLECLGEKPRPCKLADRMGKLLFEEKTADVTLIVEGERLPAHRAILITSSEYFRYVMQN